MSGPALGVGMLARYGLNQAWNSMLRLWVSSTSHASGSQPGSLPCAPLSHSDHGSYGDGQNASAAGRTCTNRELKFSRCARSSQAAYSALRVCSSSPARLGQSMFVTLAIQMPRSWRLGVAGLVVQSPPGMGLPPAPGSALAAVAVPTSTPAVPTATPRSKVRLCTGIANPFGFCLTAMSFGADLCENPQHTTKGAT